MRVLLVIYFDLSKAFDTDKHDILPQKPSTVCTDYRILLWNSSKIIWQADHNMQYTILKINERK